MSGILDIEFKLGKKRTRLGYYYGEDYETKELTKGHAFHYSFVSGGIGGNIGLFKSNKNSMSDGGWKKGKVVGTYLHTMWRC